MADFVAVIRKAVDNLLENTPENRAKVYDNARAAIRRQLEHINPPPSDEVIVRQLDKLDLAINEVESEHVEAIPADVDETDALMAELESMVEKSPVMAEPAPAMPREEEHGAPYETDALMRGVESMVENAPVPQTLESWEEENGDPHAEFSWLIESELEEHSGSDNEPVDFDLFDDTDPVENDQDYERAEYDLTHVLPEYSIPVDLPGPNFETSESGRLKLARSGHPSRTDVERIASVRLVLVEAAEELIKLSTGSNSHSQVAKIAASYRNALGDSAEDLSIDLTYAFGVRLENIQAEMAKGIESGDYQEGSPEIEEAIRSVGKLHRTVIMDTVRGRELASHARDYDNPIDIDAKREALVEIADAVKNDGAILEKEDASEIVDIVAQFEEGPSPARSNQVALLAISNLLGSLAKPLRYTIKEGADGIVGGVAWIGVVAGYKASLPFLLHSQAFFLTQAPALIKLAMLVGGDIGWIPPFIEWLKQKKNERS